MDSGSGAPNETTTNSDPVVFGSQPQAHPSDAFLLDPALFSNLQDFAFTSRQKALLADFIAGHSGLVDAYESGQLPDKNSTEFAELRAFYETLKDAWFEIGEADPPAAVQAPQADKLLSYLRMFVEMPEAEMQKLRDSFAELFPSLATKIRERQDASQLSSLADDEMCIFNNLRLCSLAKVSPDVLCLLIPPLAEGDNYFDPNTFLALNASKSSFPLLAEFLRKNAPQAMNVMFGCDLNDTDAALVRAFLADFKRQGEPQLTAAEQRLLKRRAMASESSAQRLVAAAVDAVSVLVPPTISNPLVNASKSIPNDSIEPVAKFEPASATSEPVTSTSAAAMPMLETALASLAAKSMTSLTTLEIQDNGGKPLSLSFVEEFREHFAAYIDYINRWLEVHHGILAAFEQSRHLSPPESAAMDRFWRRLDLAKFRGEDAGDLLPETVKPKHAPTYFDDLLALAESRNDIAVLRALFQFCQELPDVYASVATNEPLDRGQYKDAEMLDCVCFGLSPSNSDGYAARTDDRLWAQIVAADTASNIKASAWLRRIGCYCANDRYAGTNVDDDSTPVTGDVSNDEYYSDDYCSSMISNKSARLRTESSGSEPQPAFADLLPSANAVRSQTSTPSETATPVCRPDETCAVPPRPKPAHVEPMPALSATEAPTAPSKIVQMMSSQCTASSRMAASSSRAEFLLESSENYNRNSLPQGYHFFDDLKLEYPEYHYFIYCWLVSRPSLMNSLDRNRPLRPAEQAEIDRMIRRLKLARTRGEDKDALELYISRQHLAPTHFDDLRRRFEDSPAALGVLDEFCEKFPDICALVAEEKFVDRGQYRDVEKLLQDCLAASASPCSSGEGSGTKIKDTTAYGK